MAKTKTKSRSGSKDILRSTNTPLVRSNPQSTKTTEQLLTEAEELLEKAQPELALALSEEAVSRLEADTHGYANTEALLRLAAQEQPTYPQALVISADVHLALGNVSQARARYEKATQVDNDGHLVSAEPWLQLAQLCDEGGRKSIEYYERAIEIMKNEIEVLQEEDGMDSDVIDIRTLKTAEALCAMAEVYMTDLSWEDDAEQRCERLATEAVAVCPDSLSAGVLQTLASIRVSQYRIDEARKILTTSLDLWKDIPPEIEDPARPDFASRVSLVRLLIEVEQEQQAFDVLQGLVKEDDQSIEVRYLGGWCQLLLGQKPDLAQDQKTTWMESALTWLATCLKLYQAQAYEDDRLKDHASELVKELKKALNLPDDEEWEDTDDDKDEVDNDELEADDQDEDVEMT